MWMDAIILDTSVSADGSNDEVSQELRVSVDSDMVTLRCKGLFAVTMTLKEFDNLAECVTMLYQMANEEG